MSGFQNNRVTCEFLNLIHIILMLAISKAFRSDYEAWMYRAFFYLPDEANLLELFCKYFNYHIA